MHGEEREYGPERYPHSELTGRVIGTAQRVHRERGPGYRELFYQRALALELAANDLDFEREVRIPIHYRGKEIGRQRVDFVVERVLVEVKAKAVFEELDVVQTLSYLRALGFEIALLLNFGAKRLRVKRLIDSGTAEDADGR